MRRFRFAAGLLLAGLAGTLLWLRAQQDRSPIDAILREHRPYSLHLAGQRDLPCNVAPTDRAADDAAFQPFACQTPDRGITTHVRRAHALLASAPGDSNAQRGRLDLITAGADSTILDRAVRLLEDAARDDSSAAVLNDLAVAFAVRGAHLRRPLDLFRSLELTLRALEADSQLRAPHANLPVLQYRLSLAGRPPTAARGPPGFANRKAIREDSAMSALARWASAVNAGDSVAVERARGEIERLSTMLTDGTVARAFAAIRAADVVTLGRLASGYAAFTQAETLFRSGQHAAAGPVYRRAREELRALDDPYAWWAALGEAAVAYYATRRPSELLDTVVHQADHRVQPAAIGRALWIRGLALATSGRYQEGLRDYTDAAAMYAAADEPTNVAVMHFLSSEVLALLGRSEEAERKMLSAAAAFASAPVSTNYHDFLLFHGRYLLRQGLPRAALVVHERGEHVADSTGRTKDVAEVALRRAQAELALGRHDAAAAHLAAAERVYAGLQDAGMSARGHADVTDTKALLWLATRPADAAELLAGPLEFYRSQRNPSVIVRLLLRRGEARANADDLSGAAGDLNEAAAMADEGFGQLRSRSDSVAFREAVDAVYERLIHVQLAAGLAEEALAASIHARRLGTHGEDPFDTPQSLARSILPGHALLHFVALPDRLVTWRLGNGEIHKHETIIARADLEARIHALITAIERDDSVTARRVGEELHELLVGELADGLERLLVQPDRALGGLPFAALRSPRTGTYLVDSVQLVIVARTQPSRRAERKPGILVVDASAFDRALFPELPGLPGASIEAAAAAAAHAPATVLKGGNATPDALRAALDGHGIFHFAGHAWAHPADPERSYLITASDVAGRSTLSAADIARLDLRQLRLAVLSTCSSARGGTGVSAGVRGLTDAFLAAGASAVVASVRDVSDAATAMLFDRFHRAIADGLDPVEALRAAQQQLMHSTDPALRSPRAWAWFQVYAGLEENGSSRPSE